jgi:hypothetical protein
MGVSYYQRKILPLLHNQKYTFFIFAVKQWVSAPEPPVDIIMINTIWRIERCCASCKSAAINIGAIFHNQNQKDYI